MAVPIKNEWDLKYLERQHGGFEAALIWADKKIDYFSQATGVKWGWQTDGSGSKMTLLPVLPQDVNGYIMHGQALRAIRNLLDGLEYGLTFLHLSRRTGHTLPEVMGACCHLVFTGRASFTSCMGDGRHTGIKLIRDA